MGAVRPDSPAKPTAQKKRHILAAMPVGHARLPIWLRPLTAKRANNQGENVHNYI